MVKIDRRGKKSLTNFPPRAMSGACSGIQNLVLLAATPYGGGFQNSLPTAGKTFPFPIRAWGIVRLQTTVRVGSLQPRAPLSRNPNDDTFHSNDRKPGRKPCGRTSPGSVAPDPCMDLTPCRTVSASPSRHASLRFPESLAAVQPTAF
jgi:hypothetical protein